MSNHH